MYTSLETMKPLAALTRMASVAGCALALGVGGAALAQDVKIGAINGLTGGLAAYGPPILNGSKLAVRHVNEQGGILGGRKLVILSGDTQSTPQGAVDAAQKLISVDRVVGIIGALASGATMATASSVTAPAGIPQISPASTSPEISKLKDNDFLFRTTPHDAFQGIVLAKVVSKQGIKKVAMTYVNNDYGTGLAGAFRDAYKKLGGMITAEAPHEENKASYRAELATLARDKPEALVLIAYPDSGGKIIMRQALENAFFDLFIMTDGMRQSAVVEEIGAKNIQGSFGTGPEPPKGTSAAEKFDKAYADAFGTTEELFYIQNGYDAAMMMALAIEKAGSTEGAQIRDALRSICCPPGETIEPGDWAKARKLIAAGKDIDYVGAAGSQDFDAAGDVPGDIAHWEVQPDGALKVIDVISE